MRTKPSTDAATRVDLDRVVAEHPLRGHTGRITRIAWSPDGRWLASPSLDDSVRLWESPTWKLKHKLATESASGPLVVAFDPSGDMLAGAGRDGIVRLWDVDTGAPLGNLVGNPDAKHRDAMHGVAFDPVGRRLVSASETGTIFFWNLDSRLRPFATPRHPVGVNSIAFHPHGRILASAGRDGVVRLWDAEGGTKLDELKPHTDEAWRVVFAPDGSTLTATYRDGTIRIWQFKSRELISSKEGHRGHAHCGGFSCDGRLIATRGGEYDNWICLWSSGNGERFAKISHPGGSHYFSSLAFHPTNPWLAVVDSDGRTNPDQLITILELDLSSRRDLREDHKLYYSCAKILLVGDSGVGKTGLGWRLAHGSYKAQEPTHGQQHWELPLLGGADPCPANIHREAVLCDLAGQNDYRLIHALFLENTDLALVVFDPADHQRRFHGVEYWLNQLRAAGTGHCPPILLVAARCDLPGSLVLTDEDLNKYCQGHGIQGWIRVSAKTEPNAKNDPNDGVTEYANLEELRKRMDEMIPWSDKEQKAVKEQQAVPINVALFGRIRSTVEQIKRDQRNEKKSGRPRQVLASLESLRARLASAHSVQSREGDNLKVAVDRLANLGTVRYLCVEGTDWALLEPELLNNLAARMIFCAREASDGRGCLDEQGLLDKNYKVDELTNVLPAERPILIRAAVDLFKKHNICCNMRHPGTARDLLFFPGLVTRRPPAELGERFENDGVLYTMCEATALTWPWIVAQLGRETSFVQIGEWENRIRYRYFGIPSDPPFLCDLRLEAERSDELDLALYFSANTPGNAREAMRGTFKAILDYLALKWKTTEPYKCLYCNRLHNLAEASDPCVIYCCQCGRPLRPWEQAPVNSRVEGPTHMDQRSGAEAGTRAAPGKSAPASTTGEDDPVQAKEQRHRLELAVVKIRDHRFGEWGETVRRPSCFISYSWDLQTTKDWVQQRFAVDLKKAGIEVLLDIWNTSGYGDTPARFAEKHLPPSERILVIGTPDYKRKYSNEGSPNGCYLAAEADLINERLVGSETNRRTVVPILLAGTPDESLPPYIATKWRADFRHEGNYVREILKLILALYGRPHEDRDVTALLDHVSE
jgi:WD40 repeat protein/GTPase SAR1 family protein